MQQRARAAEAIAWSNQTLAKPRPGAEGQARADEAFAASLAAMRQNEPEAAPTVPQPAAGSARPAAGPFLTIAQANARQDAMEQAVALSFATERMAFQRRIAELERLDVLEGSGD